MIKQWILPLLMSCITLCAACDKMPKNGDLDGQWQLTAYRCLNPEAEAVEGAPDTRPQSGIYWCFQLDMLMIFTPNANHNGHTAYTAARFLHTDGELKVTDTYIHHMDRDSLLDHTTTCLRQVGISSNRETFVIDTLTAQKMVLHSPNYRLSFRKY